MWFRRKDPALRPDDGALVRRMLAGEEAAFEEYFEANFQGLYRFVLVRVGNDGELAKELAQAAICKAVERLETYRGEAPLFSWLCAFCRFEISAHFRKLRRLPPEVALVEEGTLARAALDSLPFELDGPEDQMLRREVARLVHVTLDHLPLRYRNVLEWKYVSGLPVLEIAARLGVSPKAAESLLTRARQSFRDGFSALSGGAPPGRLGPGEAIS